MPRSYNAVQAARELDISDKTIRRYIEKGKIAATRKESGELAISEEEVEKLRAELDLERSYQKYRQSLDMPLDNVLDMARQIEDLTARVSELESRLAQLESRQVPPSVQPSQQTPSMPIPQPATSAATPKTKPQKSLSTRKDLPEGCILASKFAEQLGIPRETMRDYLTLGIGPGTVPGKETHPLLPVKDVMEYSERPWPGREHTGEKQRYFTPAQQEQAIFLLRKHGKLS